jgi:thiol-disulfide isomerase/thioredoxin
VAPPFALPVRAGPGAAEGDRISLEALRGRVVILDFWASWCGPCRESVPVLNQVGERFSESPVSIVGVNVEADLTPQHVVVAHQALGSTLPSVQDETGSLQDAYGVRSLPTIVVIDRQGRIVRSEAGVPDADDLVAEITNLLE